MLCRNKTTQIRHTTTKAKAMTKHSKKEILEIQTSKHSVFEPLLIRFLKLADPYFIANQKKNFFETKNFKNI